MILLAPAALGSGAKSAHGRVLVGAAVRFGFVVAQGSYCGDVDVDWSASDYAALVGRTASVPARAAIGMVVAESSCGSGFGRLTGRVLSLWTAFRWC